VGENDLFQRLDQGLDRVREAVNASIDGSQEAGETLRTEVQRSIDELEDRLDSVQRQTRGNWTNSGNGSSSNPYQRACQRTGIAPDGSS
jgi:hypothetical protein